MKLDNIHREKLEYGRMGSVVAFILIVVIALMSCAHMTDSEKNLAIELVVKASASRVLVEKPEWKDDVVRITGAALGYMTADVEATVESLEEFTIGQISWEKLTVEERALIVVLMATVREDLQRYVKEHGGEQEGLKVRVAEVLGWINQTARSVPD